MCVATKCRMCGERNYVAKPVMRVHATGCRQQYYCFSCWFIISERAAVDVPELANDSPADANVIGLLFGIKRELTYANELDFYDARTSTAVNLTVCMRKSLIVDNTPFKRYMLTGAELESYKQKRGLGG